jgi:hypothetical protein
MSLLNTSTINLPSVEKSSHLGQKYTVPQLQFVLGQTEISASNPASGNFIFSAGDFVIFISIPF